jgi:sec-independent protein translocase protein TatA
MLHFSPLHIVLLFAVVLLLFGAKKVPELARGLGEGMKEFKQAVREVNADAGEEPPKA